MTQEYEESFLRRAFTNKPRDARPRPDCPAPDQLWLGVRGELEPESTRELILHVAVCPLCTEAWRLAEELERGVGDVLPFSPSAVEERRRPLERRLTQRLAAVAAVLLACLALLPLLFRGSAPQEPVVRGEGSDPIHLLSPEALPRDDFRLRWDFSAAPGVEEKDIRFHLRISPRGSMDLLVDVQDHPEKEYVVAPEVLADLGESTVLRVWIEARHPLEGSLAASTFFITVP